MLQKRKKLTCPQNGQHVGIHKTTFGHIDNDCVQSDHMTSPTSGQKGQLKDHVTVAKQQLELDFMHLQQEPGSKHEGGVIRLNQEFW